MRKPVAISLLATSATVMLAGLGVAFAQEPPQQQGGVQVGIPPRDRLPGGIPPGVGGVPGGLRQLVPGGTPPGTGDTSGAGGGGHAEPFVTGIDYEPTPPGAPVTFNLEDADLPDLVRLISSITGKRFILPGKARSIKASVYAPTKVTAAEAYQAFLSILQLNGMTVEPSGRYLKIVDTTGIEATPITTYTAGEATPSDDRYITRMHRVANVSAEDIATLLGRFKSREGNVTAYAPTNTVIMTDMGSNIRRMLRIVEAIDVPRAGEQVWVEPVHYANAKELADKLTEIFPVTQPAAGGGRPAAPAPPPGADGSGGPSTIGQRGSEFRITKILSDDRTNSLIIVATERAYMRIIEMIRALDIPLEGEGRIHVQYVQHGDAEQIAQTLSTIVGGGGGGGSPSAGGAPTGGAGAGGAGTPFEGQVRITAHKPTNSLVITSSLHDYSALRSVIDRLDIERRQVFIELVIMELSVKRTTKLGLAYHGGIPDSPEAGALSIFGFNAGSSLSPVSQDSLTGLALGVRGPTIANSQSLIGLSVPAFGVVLNAIATSGDVNVLSTPHLIAMDNEEASINVGENLPLQQSNGGSPFGAGGIPGLPGGIPGLPGQTTGGIPGVPGFGGGFGMGGAVPRQDVGTKIKITPHINDSGEIRLEIDEEISERGATEGALQVVSITKRNAKTQVVVRDQQTVVIGGLMRDTVNTSQTKIPILGDIPLLGVLFRQENRTTQKTNLLLFLTPYIVRNQADLRAIFERKMRERQEFIDRFFVFGDQDYQPPLDYSRTRGIVAEITSTLEDAAEEQRLLVEAEARPPPEHVPRPAIGSTGDSTPVAGDTIISPDGTTQVVPGVIINSNTAVGVQPAPQLQPQAP